MRKPLYKGLRTYLSDKIMCLRTFPKILGRKNVFKEESKNIVYFTRGCPPTQKPTERFRILFLIQKFQSWGKIVNYALLSFFIHFHQYQLKIYTMSKYIHVKNRKNPGIEPNHKDNFDFVKTNEETLNVKSGQIGGECFCFPNLKY